MFLAGCMFPFSQIIRLLMDLTKENMQALGQRNPVHFFCFLVEGKNIYNLKKEEKKIPIISLVRVSMIEARNAKEKECSIQLGL